jgi:hypothetical protein
MSATTDAGHVGFQPNNGPWVVVGLTAAAALTLVVLWLSPLLAVGTVGLAGLSALLFWHTRAYTYLYLAITLLPYSFLEYLDDFRLFSKSEANINLVGVLWVLNVVLFLIYTAVNRRKWWQFSIYRPSFLLIGITLPAILFTSNWMLGLRAWVHLISPICLSLLLFSSINDRKDAVQTVKHIILIFSVALVPGLYQFVTGTGSYDTKSDSFRISGIYGVGGEVNFAAILLYLVCLLAPFALQRKSELKAWAIAVGPIAALLLVASESRLPFLALIFASLVIFRKSKVRLKYWALIIAVIGAAQVSPQVYSRFGGPLLGATTQFQQNPEVYVNLIQRGEAWVMLSSQFLNAKTILVGRGYGFVDNFMLYEIDDPLHIYPNSVHNEYLRLLIDLGVTGVALFIVQAVLIYRASNKIVACASDSLSRGLGISLCGLVISYVALALTSNMFGVDPHAVTFWVLAAPCLTCLKWDPSVPPSAFSELA